MNKILKSFIVVPSIFLFVFLFLYSFKSCSYSFSSFSLEVCDILDHKFYSFDYKESLFFVSDDSLIYKDSDKENSLSYYVSDNFVYSYDNEAVLHLFYFIDGSLIFYKNKNLYFYEANYYE